MVSLLNSEMYSATLFGIADGNKRSGSCQFDMTEQQMIRNNPKRTILLATVGTSPAVVTETIWALAHPVKKGVERIVPDEIVVLTTLRGKQIIQSQLFGVDRVWERLVATLKKQGLPVVGRLSFGEASIRILDHDKKFLEDIRTAGENESVANLFLDEVTRFTETAGTRLLASIAGGRKTMGALLLSCMCLRGREQDRVLHILVNEPYETRLDPPFFFPEAKKKHAFIDPSTGRKQLLRSQDARLDLVDLPFVKMRGWYQDKFKSLPPRYSDLVHAAQSSGPAATMQKPMLQFDFAHGSLSIGEIPLRLSATEFAALSLDLLRAPDSLLSALPAVHIAARKDRQYGWFQDFGDGSRFSSSDAIQAQEDLTKVRNQLRTKLRQLPAVVPFIKQIVPRGAEHGVWPAARMSADIPDFWNRVLP